jgi:hypothetical protein
MRGYTQFLLAIAGAVLIAGMAAADQAKPAQQAKPPAQQAKPETPAAPAKLVPPVRGVARLGYLKPVTKRSGNTIVTTIRVKNLSEGSIAGLRVDDNWYDKKGEPVAGDTFRHRRPLQPGEILEITLTTPINPAMDRNAYRFVHANGDIKAELMAKF